MESDKKVVMQLFCKGTFVDGDDPGRPDVLGAYPDEVCRGIAAYAGVSARTEDNVLIVEIPLPDGDSPAAAEAPSAELGRGFFNAFNIMPKDLDD